MRILVTGATGLIGSALVETLAKAGHELLLGVRDVDAARRRWPGHDAVEVDYVRDHQASDWLPRLSGIDAVINAVGILREHGDQTFDALHVRAPRALFAACVDARVGRVIQISALGADAEAVSGYHRSKREADMHLAGLPLRSTIVQPSLVFAAHGASASAMLTVAALPWVPLPGTGEQRIAPVHLDDVCSVVLQLLSSPTPPARLAVVGPHCLSLHRYLAALRHAMDAGPPRFVRIPIRLGRIAAAVMGRLSRSPFDRDALAMLERGNCADADELAEVLGHPPRPVEYFIERDDAVPVRRTARLRWLLPMLRIAIALVWIVTGIVSLGPYPISASLDLLARAGLTGTPALIALYGAAVLDLALGIATLTLRRRRLLYKAQALLILAYTAIITLHLPEFWLHPYGPVLKNLPMLVALWLLHDLED